MARGIRQLSQDAMCAHPLVDGKRAPLSQNRFMSPDMRFFHSSRGAVCFHVKA